MEWQRNPTLRAEFGELSIYQSFARAQDAGRQSLWRLAIMALAADTPRVYELGDINELTVASAVTIYEGAFVFALKADGTAVVASPAISPMPSLASPLKEPRLGIESG